MPKEFSESEYTKVWNWYVGWQKERKENERRLVEVQRNREKSAASLGTHTEDEWTLLVELCGDKCVMCGISKYDLIGNTLTKDHVIPLTFEGRSSNSITNIQPLCRHCNSRKQDSNCIDFVPKAVRDLMRHKALIACGTLPPYGYRSV